MKKLAAILFTASLTLLGTGSMAHAARGGAHDADIGALLGFNAVSNGGGTNLAYGLTAGYRFHPMFSAGLHFTYNSLTVASPFSSSMTIIALEGNYHFGGDLEGLFAGLKLGSGSISNSGGGVSSSTSGMAIGPAVGYDYAVADDWTVGGQLAILSIATNPSVTATQILAQAKYWF